MNRGAISRTGNGGSFSRICCSINPPHQRESLSGSFLSWRKGIRPISSPLALRVSSQSSSTLARCKRSTSSIHWSMQWYVEEACGSGDKVSLSVFQGLMRPVLWSFICCSYFTKAWSFCGSFCALLRSLTLPAVNREDTPIITSMPLSRSSRCTSLVSMLSISSADMFELGFDLVYRSQTQLMCWRSRSTSSGTSSVADVTCFFVCASIDK